MNLIKIFEGSFSGSVLFENSSYIAPMLHRQLIKEKASIKFFSFIKKEKNFHRYKSFISMIDVTFLTIIFCPDLR